MKCYCTLLSCSHCPGLCLLYSLFLTPKGFPSAFMYSKYMWYGAKPWNQLTHPWADTWVKNSGSYNTWEQRRAVYVELVGKGEKNKSMFQDQSSSLHTVNVRMCTHVWWSWSHMVATYRWYILHAAYITLCSIPLAHSAIGFVPAHKMSFQVVSAPHSSCLTSFVGDKTCQTHPESHVSPSSAQLSPFCFSETLCDLFSKWPFLHRWSRMY